MFSVTWSPELLPEVLDLCNSQVESLEKVYALLSDSLLGGVDKSAQYRYELASYHPENLFSILTATDLGVIKHILLNNEDNRYSREFTSRFFLLCQYYGSLCYSMGTQMTPKDYDKLTKFSYGKEE